MSASIYFDGAVGNYLSIGTNVIDQIGDFTAECYFKNTVASQNGVIFYLRGNTNRYAGCRLQVSTSNRITLLVSITGTTWAIVQDSAVNSFTFNTWNHIAVVRNGDTFTVYLNGNVIIASTAVSSTTSLTAGTVNEIGRAAYSSDFQYFVGYLSSIRIVKSALYISSFSVPTTLLTTSANTVLLAGQETDPFDDKGPNNKTLTAFGNATFASLNPFSNTTNSLLFDGAGDYLTTTGQNLSAENWTIECWVYFISFANTTPHIFNFGTNVNNRYMLFRSNVNSKFIFATANGGVYTDANSTTTPQIGTWYHVAVVRNSGVSTLYINGSQEGTSNTSIDSGTNWSIGFQQFGGATNDYVNGYISNFRVVKGTAIYTSNFSVPTQALSAITGTSLLTCQGSPITDAGPNNFTITVSGDVIATSFNPFSTTKHSLSFDGNGDYISVTGQNLSSGSWTIECWVYFKTFVTNTGPHIFNFGTDVNNRYLLWRDGSSGKFAFVTVVGGTYERLDSNIIPKIGVWYHVAVVRDNGISVLYIDGIPQGNLSTNINAGTNWAIGFQPFANVTADYLNGFISNFRVETSAIYASSFTPPALPVLSVTGTSLLIANESNNVAIIDNSSNNITITPVPTTLAITSINPSSPEGSLGTGIINSEDFNYEVDYYKLSSWNNSTPGFIYR